jgi:tRNA pseudouridine38-40 synthase
LRLDLSYDGTGFSGWARQPNLRTVAQVVEEALATVMRLDSPARLVVAGRTDTGVHALGQVAHVDVPSRIGRDVPSRIGGDVPSRIGGDVPSLEDDLAMTGRRLAGILPADVAVRGLAIAPAGFDARFSALARHYVYRVDDGPPNPLRRYDTLGWPRSLDIEAMQLAATGLVGQHDFAAYAKHREGATTIRTLQRLDVIRDRDGVVLVTASADAFCRHQVRSMVGALISVGEGRRPVGWPAEVLQAGQRLPIVHVAAAKGLTLAAVDYPPDDQLAARTAQTRQRRIAAVRTG